MINPINVGKHKIPKYMYHLTTQRSYESMLRDGFIKTSEDRICGQGVFLIELANFFRCWKTSQDWDSTNLQLDLIYQVKKFFSDGLVLLRIPAKNLESDKLKVRSQNRLFSWVKNNEDALYKIKNSDRGDESSRIRKLVYLTEKDENKTNLFGETPAKDSSLFKKRKEAVEYIYKDDIPIDSVEKIGEIEAALTRFFLNNKSQNSVKSIFLELLQGQNERKGAELLK